MKYGYFDDINKEYVITKPDTPRSWTNYLGDTNFCSVITNNAGGYTFYKSAAQGRFVRARLNAIPMDQPGRYLYLRDRESGDYWSNSWQPVAKPLDKFNSKCRVGTGYSVISSEYDKIATETTYFVPLGKTFECWKVKITNLDDKIRKLSAFSFVEYANNWNAIDDIVNLQYTQYILQMNVFDGIIDHGINVYMPSDPNNFQNKDQGRHTFMALAGINPVGFDTDRDVFIGPYRNYSNPIVVENGICENSIAHGDNGCGVQQVDIQLEPNETIYFSVLVGIGSAQIEGRAISMEFSDIRKVETELEKLKSFWNGRLEGFIVDTPDKDFNSMMHTWNPYNNLITFALSGIASLV